MILCAEKIALAMELRDCGYRWSDIARMTGVKTIYQWVRQAMQVLSEEEMGIGHDRKAGPVLWFGKPVPGLIYAAPPAAQDVSGLPDRPTEEMKRAGANAMADAQRDGSSSFYAYAAVCWEAMAEAHRAQAQGGDV